MSEPLARLYDLALRSLDEQQRRADAIRARLAPVLAAAALGAAVLSGPVVGSGGQQPASLAERLALVVAAGGLAWMLLAVFRLLSARGDRTSKPSVGQLAAALSRETALDDAAAFYSAMITRLAVEQTQQARQIERLARTFTSMLRAITVMLCGLALTALVG